MPLKGTTREKQTITIVGEKLDLPKDFGFEPCLLPHQCSPRFSASAAFQADRKIKLRTSLCLLAPVEGLGTQSQGFLPDSSLPQGFGPVKNRPTAEVRAIPKANLKGRGSRGGLGSRESGR